tara:strand:- start:372 stop:641 length:270 start_codon:yes stop_codon:yes gene_type:complete
MNRNFIFRAAKGRDKLNYLGYVLNVGSPTELNKAVSELGFNVNMMEFKSVPQSSKAIAVCMPFKSTAHSKDNNFILLKDITCEFFEEEV